MADLDVSDVLRLSSDLKRSSNRLGRDAASVVRKSAQQLKSKAQANAPVETGALRGSIAVSSITGSGRGGSISAEVSASIRYASFVEYGTSKMAPRPYMGPALDAVAPAFVEALSALSEDALG